MKSLKTILWATYIVLIILLLLSLLKCDGPAEHPPIKETFKADVVLCIDCTGSMAGMINTIKKNALRFYPDMKEKCLSYGKEITSMRIRVIGFRDLSDRLPYEQSGFFNLPEQSAEFKSYVSHFNADGGGDAPEIAYDALGLAMTSEWLDERDVRQVIILWTDAASHPISSFVPGPTSFGQMTNIWNEEMNARGKRLILFAPEDITWTTITDSWDNTTRHDVSYGTGLAEIDYEKIIKALSESI